MYLMYLLKIFFTFSSLCISLILSGVASGSWVAGVIYQNHGASFTFACFGTFALVSQTFTKLLKFASESFERMFLNVFLVER